MRQSPWEMDKKQYDTEFCVGVAAAAYAINSIEEDEEQHRIKIERSSRQDSTTRMRNSDRVTRRYSSKEMRTAGETSIRKPMEQDYRRQGSTLATSKPDRSSAARAMTKAYAWEKAQLDKLNKRYENMKASILAWENDKKLRAKAKMDMRKKELEQKIKRTQQLYQSKIARIDKIAGGARAQVDEQRRNEELKIKEKARQIRASGQVPVTCFCF